jgi:carboxyl-terminal processing protease
MGLELGLVGVTSPTGQEIVSASTQVKVVDVVSLSRAYYDGLMKDDIILSIDDIDLTGKSFQEVIALLPTQEESTVRFSIQRDTQILSLQTAAEENMAWFLNDGILYLNIRAFSAQTGSRAISDVERLKAQQNFSKIILDLRGNGGGRSSGARDLLDFLGDFDSPSKSTLMYESTPQSEQHFFGDSLSQNIGVHGKENLVILLDGSSASASELVAGTLKLLGGATIIGQTSFGKGVSQSVYTLVDGTGVWVTSSELLLNGTFGYHGIGITPDHTVSTTPSLGSDPAILAAQSYLSGQLILAKPILNDSQIQEVKPRDPLLDWIDTFGKVR